MATEWTVDRLHHALPHPENRRVLVEDVNMTPLAELPEKVQPWVDAAERLEAARPDIERLRAYAREHGDVPPDLDSVADAEELLTRDAGRRRGAA